MALVTFHFFISLRHENLTSPVTVTVFTDQNLVRYCRTNEIAVAQRLARWTPHQAVWVPALVGVTACCSSTRHFTLTVLLSSHGHKWGTEKINAVYKPSIEYQFTRRGGDWNTGYCFMLTGMNFALKQKRGVDDTEKLPYYPYRDDGKLLYQTLNEFADSFIDAYVTQYLWINFIYMRYLPLAWQKTQMMLLQRQYSLTCY